MIYPVDSAIQRTFEQPGPEGQTARTNQTPGGGDTWVFFGWVCAARESKLAPRSKKNFPKNRYPVPGQFFIPRSKISPKTDTPF